MQLSNCLILSIKKVERDLQFPSSNIIESSIPRLTQLITRAAVSFYFRRYGERNHAGLVISLWKAAQVLALDSMREE